jgi:hypothetical protein
MSKMEEDAKRFHSAVVKEVLEAVRNIFHGENIPEEALEKLKGLWEGRMLERSQRGRHDHHFGGHHESRGQHFYPNFQAPAMMAGGHYNPPYYG